MTTGHPFLRWLLALLLCSLAVNLYLLRAYTQLSGEQSSATAGPAVEKHHPARPASQLDKPDKLTAADIELLFEAGEFDSAIEGYYLLQQQDQQLARELKSGWLEQVRDWLKGLETSARARAFIEAAVDFLPRDFDFRLLNAERHAADSDMATAVDLFYLLLNESPYQVQDIIVGQLQALVKAHVTELSEQQSWQALRTFAERLLWHEPLHAPYIFIHARAQIELQQYEAAKSGLLNVLHDQYHGGRAQQLLDEIALLELADTAIALQSVGAHYLVDGLINNRHPVRLMIDTGASLSVISTATLQSLSAHREPVFVRESAINTAGGKITAPVYRVQSFQLDNYRVKDMEFVVLDIDDTKGMGLLGMNFLRNFVFQIDQQNHLLLLSPNG